MSDGFGGTLPIRLFLSSQNVDLIFALYGRAPVSDRGLYLSRLVLIFRLLRQEGNEFLAAPTAVL